MSKNISLLRGSCKCVVLFIQLCFALAETKAVHEVVGMIYYMNLGMSI